jgi:hypothetical protein
VLGIHVRLFTNFEAGQDNALHEVEVEDLRVIATAYDLARAIRDEPDRTTNLFNIVVKFELERKAMKLTLSCFVFICDTVLVESSITPTMPESMLNARWLLLIFNAI